MKKLISDKLCGENDRWPVFHATVMMIILGMTLLTFVMVGWWPYMYHAHLITILSATAALYFYKMRLSGGIEVRLMILFTLWVFISRILNGDWFLLQDRKTAFDVLLICMALPVGLVLKPRQREAVFNGLAVLMGGAFTLYAIAGIWSALTNTAVVIPPENLTIKMVSYGNYMALETSTLIHNSTAIWLYVGLGLMLCQFFRCKRKLWRVTAALSAALMYVAIGLSHCRTIQIAVGVSAGMLALLLGMRYVKMQNKALRISALAVLMALAMLVGFKGLDWSASACSNISDAIVARNAQAFTQTPDTGSNERQSAEQSGETPALPGAIPEIDYTDKRNGIFHNYTFSGRTVIWTAVPTALSYNPKVLLTGQMREHMMDNVNLVRVQRNHQAKAMPNMHNYLLETLMLTGLPGLLLVSLFSLILAIKMFRVFFTKQPQVSFALKLLTIPLAGLFIDSLMESLLFTTTNSITITFFIIAGIFIADYRDAFPGKQESKESVQT